MDYQIFRNSLGQVDAINKQGEVSVSLPLPINEHEGDPLVIELLAWEAENGALDLSDRESEPVPEIIGYRVNKLLPSDRCIEGDRFPEDINFNTELVIGLTTKTIDYFGLRVAQIFYQSLDPETRELIPAQPVVFERYKYTWDGKNKLGQLLGEKLPTQNVAVPLGRVKEIYFYKEDNSLSLEFKLLPKEFYNVSDRADITTRRRQTVLAWLIARATELGLGGKVKDYFANYKDLTDKYVLYGDCQILKTVKNSAESWLDLDTTTSLGTIRNAIAICFTKALEPTGNAEVDKFLQGQI